jgi:hypothetical protein
VSADTLIPCGLNGSMASMALSVRYCVGSSLLGVEARAWERRLAAAVTTQGELRCVEAAITHGRRWARLSHTYVGENQPRGPSWDPSTISPRAAAAWGHACAG